MTETTTDNAPAPSADEQPKAQIAKKVVATKRQYFFPEHGRTVEAESADKALAMIEKDNNRKDGDG